MPNLFNAGNLNKAQLDAVDALCKRYLDYLKNPDQVSLAKLSARARSLANSMRR